MRFKLNPEVYPVHYERAILIEKHSVYSVRVRPSSRRGLGGFSEDKLNTNQTTKHTESTEELYFVVRGKSDSFSLRTSVSF